jgi:hypothetical protein
MRIHSPVNCQKIVVDAAGYFVFLAVESLVDASSPKFFLPSAFSNFSWVLMKVSSGMSTRNLRFRSWGGRHSGAQMSSMVFSLSSMSCLLRLDNDILIFLLLSGACGPSDLESSENLTVSSELVEVVRYRPRLAEYLVFFLMIVFWNLNPVPGNHTNSNLANIKAWGNSLFC